MDNETGFVPDENDTVMTTSEVRCKLHNRTDEHICHPSINPDTGLPYGLKAASKPPKKNCKKCHGRGHIGWIDGDKDKPYPCNCTIEIVKDEPEPFKEKTATESAMKDYVPPPPEPNCTTNELPKPPSA